MILVICASALSAQKKGQPKDAVVIVTGKVLSQKDSLQVTDLFFEGLHEKMLMNYQQAASYFTKVIEIDPANDAAMYELANMSFSENRADEAETLIRNAVTVKPDNEWYWGLLSDIYKKAN